MLMFIVTIVATGKVTNVQPLDTYMPILDEFEAWCKNLTRSGYPHTRVTLWDTDTNMSHGSREVNVPESVKVPAPTTDEIRAWIKTNCRENLDALKKIQVIKDTRNQFFSQDPSGFRLSLKEAKEHVEAVMLEEKKARLQSKAAPCGSGYCTYTYCDCY